jgi:hypothetical protein
VIYLAVICAIALVGAGLVIAALLDERGRAERAWREERAELVQRIQAPQMAVVAHHNAGAEAATPPAVDVTEEGDGDFWEAKDEMAQRLAAMEVNGGNHG